MYADAAEDQAAKQTRIDPSHLSCEPHGAPSDKARRDAPRRPCLPVVRLSTCETASKQASKPASVPLANRRRARCRSIGWCPHATDRQTDGRRCGWKRQGGGRRRKRRKEKKRTQETRKQRHNTALKGSEQASMDRINHRIRCPASRHMFFGFGRELVYPPPPPPPLPPPRPRHARAQSTVSVLCMYRIKLDKKGLFFWRGFALSFSHLVFLVVRCCCCCSCLKRVEPAAGR
ncbi:hypothetical protein BC567DRAFT_66739 [Phyllosticta citribraziliensis]